MPVTAFYNAQLFNHASENHNLQVEADIHFITNVKQVKHYNSTTGKLQRTTFPVLVQFSS
jgi:hypothetical protein